MGQNIFLVSKAKQETNEVLSLLQPSQVRKLVRDEAFTAVKIQAEFFWLLTSFSVAVGYQSFRGPCCPHLQGDGGSRNIQKAVSLPQH
jgi:hypothetical protein